MAPLNDVASSYEMNPNSSYVMNPNSNADTSSPTKKRKVSSHDLPGPSTDYYASSNDAPMSEFYQSLLESSYQDDLSCKLTNNFLAEFTSISKLKNSNSIKKKNIKIKLMFNIFSPTFS